MKLACAFTTNASFCVYKHDLIKRSSYVLIEFLPEARKASEAICKIDCNAFMLSETKLMVYIVKHEALNTRTIISLITLLIDWLHICVSMINVAIQTRLYIALSKA